MYRMSDIEQLVWSGDGSALKRSMLISKLRKGVKRGGALPDLPRGLRWNLCRLRLSRGEWDWAGWELRSDWSFGMHYGAQEVPLWRGGDCDLLLVGEEGVGDEIMALSCLGDLLKETRVTVECDERLMGVVERSFGVRCIPRQHDWVERRKFDAFLPMLDLLPRYRRSPKDCPGAAYLVPDRERVGYWRDRLPGHVGVAWKGRHGSIRLKPVENAVSLQYGDSVEWAKDVLDPVRDFADMVNLVAALDRVISCPQSVVHVAGALGVPAEVHMPARGSGEVNNTLHWRYLCGMPFYRSVSVV